MPPTKWTPLPIKEGGTDGTTPKSARRALGISEGASSDNMVSVKDFPFGAVGDGVTDDTAAILAAFAAIKAAGGGILIFPYATYFLGSFSTAVAALDISALQNCTIEGCGSELLITTTANVQPAILQLTNPSHVLINNLRGRDSGFDRTQTWKGAKFISFTATGSTDCGNVTLNNCSSKSVVTCIDAFFTSGTARVKNVTAINCYADTPSYYGIVLREQGDNFRAINFTAINAIRASYVYGIKDANIEVDVYHDGIVSGSDAACIVGRVVFDTKGVKYRASFHGSLAQYGGGVVIEHIPTAGTTPSTIDDVEIDFHMSDATYSVNNIPIRIRSYTTGGALETTTSNIFDRISVSGNFEGWDVTNANNPIFIETTPTTTPPPRLAISEALFDYFSAVRQIFPGFVVKRGPDTYVYTKTGDLTAGSISIDLSKYNGHTYGLRIKSYAEADHTTGSTAQCYHEVVQLGYVTGSVVTIGGTTEFHVINNGAGTTQTFAVSGATVTLTTAGAGYTGANAYLRVIVEHLAKFL